MRPRLRRGIAFPEMAIDVDQHIHEPRSMWLDYADPGARADALSIVDDELGYSWLTWRGRRLYLAEVQQPGKAKPIGELRKRLEAGLPCDDPYDDALLPEYTDAKARAAKLDEWGLDRAVVLPNFGLLWEGMLSQDLPALCANMRAYNRWIAGVTRDGGGRLDGVAHVTLRDPDWLRAELRALADSGVKAAMVAPAPVEGRALGDPALDPVWRAFVDNDVAVVFHVGGFEPPLHPAWYDGDPEPVDKVMGSVFLWVAPAVAIASMAIHGTFERFPGLRVGVIELTAHWVPQFLLMLDGSWGFYAARHGAPLRDLPMRPSEYVRRQVRVAALAYEQPSRLIEQAGDLFMFGSDWPHAEGIADPLATYERCIDGLAGASRDALLSGNARWLLGR